MRQFKRTVLILTAICVTSAWSASISTADDFTAEQYPVTITAKNLFPSDKTLVTTGTVNCTNTSYHWTIAAATTSSSATPTYSGCTAFGFPATVDVNSCRFVFNIGAATTGDADVVCEAGKTLTITAISAGTTKCTVHIGSQSDIQGTVTYSNTGSGTTREVGLGASLSGIDYSHTKGTGLGACTAGSATSGTSEFSMGITAEKEGTNTHVGIFLG